MRLNWDLCFTAGAAGEPAFSNAPVKVYPKKSTCDQLTIPADLIATLRLEIHIAERLPFPTHFSRERINDGQAGLFLSVFSRLNLHPLFALR